MEFRKKVMITLYVRQQKRHRCIELSFGLSGRRGRVGWLEKRAMKHVYYYMWNRSLVQVRYMKQGVQGWCTGMTERDGMRRTVRGGSGWGTHVHPWLIHVNVWQNPPLYCKVISLQLKKKGMGVVRGWVEREMRLLYSSTKFLELCSNRMVVIANNIIL